MRYLLDTNVLLWWIDDPDQLSETARQAITATDTTAEVSLISTWEIAIKHGIGRLDLAEKPEECIPYAMQENAFVVLPINADHCFAAGALPLHHRDPFDRMLIAQARIEDMTIITADRAFEPYDVSLLKAV